MSRFEMVVENVIKHSESNKKSKRNGFIGIDNLTYTHSNNLLLNNVVI